MVEKLWGWRKVWRWGSSALMKSSAADANEAGEGPGSVHRELWTLRGTSKGEAAHMGKETHSWWQGLTDRCWESASRLEAGRKKEERHQQGRKDRTCTPGKSHEWPRARWCKETLRTQYRQGPVMAGSCVWRRMEGPSILKHALSLGCPLTLCWELWSEQRHGMG